MTLTMTKTILICAIPMLCIYNVVCVIPKIDCVLKSVCVLRRPSTQFWIKRPKIHKNDCGMWMQNENMPEK